MKKLRLIQLVLLFLFTIGAYSAGPISGYFRINPSLTGKIIFHKFSGCFV